MQHGIAWHCTALHGIARCGTTLPSRSHGKPHAFRNATQHLGNKLRTYSQIHSLHWFLPKCSPQITASSIPAAHRPHPAELSRCSPVSPAPTAPHSPHPTAHPPAPPSPPGSGAGGRTRAARRSWLWLRLASVASIGLNRGGREKKENSAQGDLISSALRAGEKLWNTQVVTQD